MKRNSVSVRINLLILLLVIVIAGGLVTAAYVNNSRQVDRFYMSRTSQTSATIASLLDGGKVTRILEILLTDEYQGIRAEAEKSGDAAGIERYLREKGVMDDITELERRLDSMRDLQGAKYVYLISVMADSGIQSISYGDSGK